MAVDQHRRIAPPRLGTGGFWIALGVVAVLFGLFLMVGASGIADPGMGALGGFLAALGSGLIAVGFWLRMFSALERRLMAIEGFLKWPDQLPPPEAAASSPPEIKPFTPGVRVPGEGQY